MLGGKVLRSALHGAVYFLKLTYWRNLMNEITIIDASASFTMSVKKPEKTGSLARAIAFADSASRKSLANAIYLKQLQNGQFRPLARDIIETLVPKSAQPYVMGLIPATGPMNRANLISLCSAVQSAVLLKGTELKGQKEFMFGLVERIIESNTSDIVEA
tara:strand:- start:336 stop:815 length:480 start_codon:yes stop_codon:yes gene_type:complete